ncbi:hypothetical protein ABZ547_16830 [Streptomyces sparsogenes]|uniref:hypothetical protein n=1 Tax=Streptomyces sparsogenes TaxID=67365 RepID=UPI00340C4A33
MPLKEAWCSGASQWTTEQRRAFANDLQRSQLIAVSARFPPGQRRQASRELAAPARGLSLHVRPRVGRGEGSVWPSRRPERAGRAGRYTQHLCRMTRQENRRRSVMPPPARP